MKNLQLKIDGRFYYGWVMLFCGFMCMFICYVIKVNCSSLFYTPVCEEFGITRTAFTQINTVMTVTMLLCSAFIGRVYKKYPVRWVLSGCVALASLCYVGMASASGIWTLYFWAAVQGIGWAGATNLPVTIMVSNWFGPKVKGTAMSIGMLGSGAGALVWVNLINYVIQAEGWRAGYLAMAACNALMIPAALLLAVSMPEDKGFTSRVGDPGPDEIAAAGGVSSLKQGITGKEALKTLRWWLTFAAVLLTMIGASAFSTQFVAYFTDITGDAKEAALLYSGALGTLVVGKFLLGVLTDLLHVRRTSFIAPLFYAAVFICMVLAAKDMFYARLIAPVYMIGGALPSVIPFLIISRHFGDKEYGVMSGWMNMAGNIGQIIGPVIASLIFDITGAYQLAWMIFALLMAAVAVLYLLSHFVSGEKIRSMGYTPQ